MEKKKATYLRRGVLILVFLLAALLFFVHYASAAQKPQPEKPENPRLSRTSITCNVSDSYNLKLTGVKKKNLEKIRWTSTKPSVMKVSAKGKATACKIGTAAILAAYKGKQYQCNVTVKPAKYTISTASKSFRGWYKSKHSSSNRDYYVIRSYLERLEKTKGGTLTLKPGTYKVSGILFIPSNVTVTLSDGVTIKKYKASGTNSLFHFIGSSRSHSKITRYNGTHDSKLVGKGNATIDLRYVKEGLAIAMGHNKNITVSGITFKNMYSGHFIELDANYNAVIKNCKFLNCRESASYKEAVNLDIPDKNTAGFGVRWSSQDRTVNKKVTIKNCEFRNLDRAIGTHAYTSEKFFTGVNIHDNYFGATIADPIRICNWSKPKIQNNTFMYKGGMADRAIYCTGVISPVISGNVFNGYQKAIEIRPCKNSPLHPKAYKYKEAYNILSEKSLKTLRKNTFIDIGENVTRIKYNSLEFEIFELFPLPDPPGEDPPETEPSAARSSEVQSEEESSKEQTVEEQLQQTEPSSEGQNEDQVEIKPEGA